MTDTTPHLSLPLLVAGQAQKELTHNEALILLDAVAGAVIIVEGAPSNTPPVALSAGQAWLVGPDPVDSWAGQGDAIAVWTYGGWRFLPPRPNLCVRVGVQGPRLWYRDGGWKSPPVGPAIGAMVNANDAELRQAVELICEILRSEGMLAA